MNENPLDVFNFVSEEEIEKSIIRFCDYEKRVKSWSEIMSEYGLVDLDFIHRMMKE